MNDDLGIKGLVIAVVRGPDGAIKQISQARNIVTTAGNLFYAERSALLTVGATIGPVPTNFTNANGVPDMIMGYGTAGATPAASSNRSNITTIVSGSELALDATYPLVNDGDSDNTGAGTTVVTYLRTYAAGTATASGIDRVFLTNPSPGASEVLICYAELSSAVNKGAGDSLKIFINHTMLGS